MKTVALVPLRAGSKGIPKKNIKTIAGKPLAAWVLEAATQCPTIDTVYVSTESEEIAKVVSELALNITVIKRPSELATDEASTEAVMLHFMEQIEFDILITIQATSPLLKPENLREALNKFQENEFDSMLSAVRSKRFFWNEDGTPINYNPIKRPRRQEFKGSLMENGAFYITRRKILDEQYCRLGGKIGVYEMDSTQELEIDEPSDWEVIERLLLKKQ
jgi:CMP-N-acetylneuraminic acid synthetase